MRRVLRFFSMVLVLFGVLTALATAQAARQIEAFDDGWLFFAGDAAGADQPAFADNSWKTVRVPHDWAIAGPFGPEQKTGGAGGFAPAGVGWYRKRFDVPKQDAKKRVFVEFDGVMANSDVWINGAPLGHHASGYVSFSYELTGKLLLGGPNVLSVRVDDSEQPASRFYTGAGIYRHVRLVTENLLHTEHWSTFVTTPKVTAESAELKVETSVKNDAVKASRVRVRATVLDADDHVVATLLSAPQAIAAGQAQNVTLTGALHKPMLWEIDRPALYTMHVEVLTGSKPVDDETIRFGVREARFEAATGFWLNGKNLKIKGMAMHSDVGSLGMAAPLGAWEHRLTAMKAMGVNAIRTAHNAVAPEVLDLCDRMGFLVMDEFFDQWTAAKTPYDYHLYFKDNYLGDVRDTVRRDRNHPSIVIYSAGNEIREMNKVEQAQEILRAMVAEFHKIDPTRPVTQALFRPNTSHDYENGTAELLDVVGQNYRPLELLAAWKQKPTRKILGTENIHDLATWQLVKTHPEYSGIFVWAGTDYLGESRHWPILFDSSGVDDHTDAPKPDALEREAWWAERPVVHIARRVAATPPAPTDPGYEVEQYRPRQVVFADWTPKQQGPHEEQVEVYSNCAEVELFLNGRSLGTRARNADDRARTWTVGFTPGELKAVGRDGGQGKTQETLRTAGEPAKITLTVERGKLSSEWDDVGYVRARVTDAAGTVVPDAANEIAFSVAGSGRIVTTDNADTAYDQPFASSIRRAYRGEAIAIVRGNAGPGEMTLRAQSFGLRGAEVTLRVEP